MIVLYFILSNLWSQTDWSGGTGQLVWSDSTKFFNKSSMNYSKLPGSVLLDAPGGWQNTGQLTGATNVWALAKGYDSTIYAGGDSAALKGFVFKTTNCGTNWVNIGVPSCNWIHSLLFTSDSVLYAGTDAGVFKYKTSWSATSLTASVNTLLKTKNDTLYAGTWDGKIYKSADGNSWSQLTVNRGVRIWKIVESPDGILYAAGSRATKKDTIAGVFKSSNGLVFDTTFFPHVDRVVYSLLITKDSTIYAGTGPDSGKVFKSRNQGASWDTTQSLPYGDAVYSLIQADNGTIYAGTGTLYGYLYSSNNGINWSGGTIDVQINSIYSLLQTLDGLLYAGSNSGITGNGRVSRAGYFSIGRLKSSIFKADSNNKVIYGIVNWDAILNSGSIEVWIRTNTIADMFGVDSTRIMNSGDSIPDSFNDKGYIQYQLKLSTPDGTTSPVFNSINIEFAPYVNTEESKSMLCNLLEAYPNPFFNKTVIRYSVSGAKGSELINDLQLAIYDISGRVVHKFDKLNALSGNLNWSPKSCPAGVYFIKLKVHNDKMMSELVKKIILVK